MPLLINCSSPFAAPRHPHLRPPPHVCCHVCRAHARPCLITGWALNRRFDLSFGTAAVLAQGGGGKRCRRGPNDYIILGGSRKMCVLVLCARACLPQYCAPRMNIILPQLFWGRGGGGGRLRTPEMTK